MRAAIVSACLVCCLSFADINAQSLPEQADSPKLEGRTLFHKTVMHNKQPVFVKVVQTGGRHVFASPGQSDFDIFGGANVNVQNPASSDGMSFSFTRTLHENNTGCFPGCEGCIFSFVVSLDIEPGPNFTGTDEEFFDMWHGEDGQSEITWGVSGAGDNSGWGGQGSTPDGSPTKVGKSSEMRFTVSEYLRCNTAKNIEFTASTAVPGTAPITVNVIITCGSCNN